MGRKDEITGSAGSLAPPDAPQETALPIQPEALQAHLEQARKNEAVLKPFNPKPTTQPQQTNTQALMDAVFGKPPAVNMPDPGSPPVRDVSVVPGQGSPLPGMDPDQGQTDQLEDAIPALTDEDRKRWPAASEGESPSRGILPDLTPPKGKKEITGGFGDSGEAQYYPLNGEELRQLVLALCDTVVAEIANDLRFSMGLVYPRAKVRIRVEVEGHAEDNNAGFVIEKVRVPKEGQPGSTPLDVARQRASDVIFVVSVGRQEFAEDGHSDAPPDAMRDELGLEKPRMTRLNGPYGGIVDLPSPDVAALTR